MRIIYNPDTTRSPEKSLYLALGNFDGVHLGHQKLINQVVSKAKKDNVLSSVFTLEPHPMKVLNPEKAPLLLTGIEKKQEIIKNIGVDYLIIQKFSKSFSRFNPLDFITDYLNKHLNINRIFVGDDYRFGRGGRGDADYLDEKGQKMGFEVEVIPPEKVHNKIVSSTYIRKLIKDGLFKIAADFLGRPFSISGKVVRGDNRGRILGFPTANIKWPEGIVNPKRGVYIVSLSVNGSYYGIANVGMKPTFRDDFTDNNDRLILEVHIFNFDDSIYGEDIEVFFHEKLRSEKKFKNQKNLVEQIKKDISYAQKYFLEQRTGSSINNFLKFNQ